MGKGKPFEKGNPGGPGRPKGSHNAGRAVVALSDELAELILAHDMEAISKPAKSKAAKLRRHHALERASRMCKGRVPTRIAIAGDEGGEPVPLSYIEVGAGIDVTPKKPEPPRGSVAKKKKPSLKRTQKLFDLGDKKRKRAKK